MVWTSAALCRYNSNEYLTAPGSRFNHAAEDAAKSGNFVGRRTSNDHGGDKRAAAREFPAVMAGNRRRSGPDRRFAVGQCWRIAQISRWSYVDQADRPCNEADVDYGTVWVATRVATYTFMHVIPLAYLIRMLLTYSVRCILHALCTNTKSVTNWKDRENASVGK